ncbi:MAG: hypothetical protein H7X99_11820 [Saprospiraceae bacterium]|nr:hypothetical protein [Saprospiraceae bacterium]
MNRKNHKLLITLLIVFFQILSLDLDAQSPGWVKPDGTEFNFSANAITVLQMDGINSSNEEDLIAVFVGNEIRGLSKAILLGSYGYVHFITLYSNLGSEDMTIKVFHKESNTVYDAHTKIKFKVQERYGSLDSPLEIEVFSDNDAPLFINNVGDQQTIEGLAFTSIDMNDYLVQPDPDDIIWTYTPNADLMVDFEGSSLQVEGVSGFSGVTSLTVRATEQTTNQKFAETTILFNIIEGYSHPLWNTIPGQGIVKDSQFQIFNLNDFENQYEGPCISYDYTPLITPSDDPDIIPDWQVDGFFQNNMTVTAKIIFTPQYTFNHPDDRLAAIINGEVRGVAFPVIQDDNVLYFLTIGGGSATASITLRFYSGTLQKELTYKTSLLYVPHKIEGNPDIPFIIDFAPLEPVIGPDGNVQIIIRDTSWTGEQTFIFGARDCFFPEFMHDETNASFCIVDQESYLIKYYVDNDGDGFGGPGNFILACSWPGSGYADNNLDCDDTDSNNTGLMVGIDMVENSGPIANDGYICSGGQVMLTATGGTQYSWSTGHNSNVLDINPLISTSYTVTVTNNVGCSGSKTQIITVEGGVVLNNHNSGFGSLRNVLWCIAEGGTILYDQPVNNATILTEALTVDKNVSINGLSINARPVITVDFNNTTHGLAIHPNKTLTLINVDLKLINPQNKPFFLGPGGIHISQLSKITEE